MPAFPPACSSRALAGGVYNSESGRWCAHEELVDLLQRKDNRCCADCSSSDPKWASVNLGVFLCIECAGVHRSLGVGISRVMSTEMDSWRNEWIETCSKVGNELASQYYEHCDTGNLRPDERGRGCTRKLREIWIRAKYEYQAFAPEGIPEPWKVAMGQTMPTHSRPCAASAA